MVESLFLSHWDAQFIVCVVPIFSHKIDESRGVKTTIVYMWNLPERIDWLWFEFFIWTAQKEVLGSSPYYDHYIACGVSFTASFRGFLAVSDIFFGFWSHMSIDGNWFWPENMVNMVSHHRVHSTLPTFFFKQAGVNTNIIPFTNSSYLLSLNLKKSFKRIPFGPPKRKLVKFSEHGQARWIDTKFIEILFHFRHCPIPRPVVK